ncbi:MAG: hypothetical protein PHU56_02095 [Candidatus Pacebacteria bacterium]|nr:hypothetical protein [Candidatus Paceibacterota bacterium]
MAAETKLNQADKDKAAMEESERKERPFERVKLKFNIDDVKRFFGSRWAEFERTTSGHVDIFSRQLVLAQKGKKNWDLSEFSGLFDPLLENGKKCAKSFHGELGKKNSDKSESWQIYGHTEEVMNNHFEALKAMADFYNDNFETLNNSQNKAAAMLMNSVRKTINMANALYRKEKTDEFFRFLAEDLKEPAERSADFGFDDYAQSLGLEPEVDYSLTKIIELEKTDEPEKPAQETDK